MEDAQADKNHVPDVSSLLKCSTNIRSRAEEYAGQGDLLQGTLHSSKSTLGP